jgi:hypothetical protein
MTYVSVFDVRALAPTPIVRRIPPTPVVRFAPPEPVREVAPSAPSNIPVARPYVPRRAKSAADRVIIAVCLEMSLDYADVVGPPRWAKLKPARVEISKRLYAMGYGLSEIGRALGGKDHTTIIHYLGRKKT